jgi:hypothetical protein
LFPFPFSLLNKLRKERNTKENGKSYLSTKNEGRKLVGGLTLGWWAAAHLH